MRSDCGTAKKRRSAGAAGGTGLKLAIGIDTGGTYTDAVLYDFETKKILHAAKALTTKNE